MTPGRIAELDGLRGVAALCVVVAHYLGEVPHGFSGFMVGWYGVSFFFVLSGFLMGSIILARHQEPGFLKSFYLRRAARIIPVYLAVVCLTQLAVALTQGHAWSDEPFETPIYLLFLTNFAISFQGGGGEWLKPTWTLAVEEQFYLLLPLLIMCLPRRALLGTLAGLCGAAIAFRYVLYQDHEIATLTLLPGRMDLLLVGVILAYAVRRFDLARHVELFRIIPLVAVLALLGVAIVSRENLFPVLNPTLLGVGFASFMLAVLLGAPEGARYRSPVLVYFGQISYGLYLVHQPVSGVLHGVLLDSRPDIGSLPQVAVTILAFAVSVGLAAASWRWFEQPILRRVPRTMRAGAQDKVVPRTQSRPRARRAS